MESIFGLPAHVLFVHAPVVLMPLALLLTIVMAVKPSWRRQTGFLMSGVAVAVSIATFLAIQSGNAFDEVVGDRVDTSDHKALAMSSLWLVLGFTATTIVLAVLDRRHGESAADWHPMASKAALVGSLGLALLATVWMARTGDEGARLVWDGVL